ncbi:MAG: hypothetical protein F9K35_00695 [Burkholderiaceae bacterium]|nr:MAG: hypothetical protein F9K35_00695 [Burkholderiaceae bacterium]
MNTRLTILATIFAAAALAGCAVVPAGTVHQACELLEIAQREADLAPAWYLRAGDVLQACGVADAQDQARQAACAAQRRNGYASDCEAPQ